MRKVIPFLKAGRFTLFLSSVAIIAMFTLTFVLHGGFNLGIDFRAGMTTTIAIPASPSTEEVRETLAAINANVQRGEGNNYLIRVTTDNSASFRTDTENYINSALTSRFGNIEVLFSEFIDASFSLSLIIGTIAVIIVALALTTGYLFFRFKLNYALSALFSTLHDILFMVGFIGVMGFEVNTTAIAAILTIMAYSLNDTIVIFDRIREVTGLNKKGDGYTHLINTAITNTLDRTITTSTSTILALVPLIIFTMGNIYYFAIAVVFGIIIGSYSSVFIASSILNELHQKNALKAANLIKAKK
ncbi:MAG: protein translocase subunit SecF [Spirochaetaceae bacterium]|nr:protein translocase subunit SecF [Spirochaetaceae bacterium]